MSAGKPINRPVGFKALGMSEMIELVMRRNALPTRHRRYASRTELRKRHMPKTDRIEDSTVDSTFCRRARRVLASLQT